LIELNWKIEPELRAKGKPEDIEYQYEVEPKCESEVEPEIEPEFWSREIFGNVKPWRDVNYPKLEPKVELGKARDSEHLSKPEIESEEELKPTSGIEPT